MYTAGFPDGTTYAVKLPADVYARLMTFVAPGGAVAPAAGAVHGNYLEFAGYKVKIVKIEVTATTYEVRLV